jgi:peptidylprolyl isomerase
MSGRQSRAEASGTASVDRDARRARPRPAPPARAAVLAGALFALMLTLVLSVPTLLQAQAKKPAAPAAPAKTAAPAKATTPAAKPAAGVPQPELIVETAKGTITIKLFPDTAPKSVEHILKLVNRGFYRSQRVSRIIPGQIVQFGDPQSRDMTLREWWGRGPHSGSGEAIGTGEISKKHLHLRGAVGMAHPGDPAAADSQMYITTRALPNLDGKYTVIGQVTAGMDIVLKLQVTDVIKNITAKGVPGT